MEIENLGIAKIAHRVWTAEGWGDDEPSCSEGHLVTAAVRETVRVAHAREDALLEALKSWLEIPDVQDEREWPETKITRELIRQMEESR